MKLSNRLFVGHGFSILGSSFSYIATMAKYSELAGSSAGWAYLAVCKAVPFLVFGLFSGYLVDNFDRRYLVSCGDGIRFVLTLAVAFCSSLTQLFVLTFLISIFESTYNPALKSLMSHFFSPEEFLAFNSVEETVRSALQILGIALSGVFLEIIGVRMCFVVDALSFLISALNIWTMNIPSLTEKRGNGESVWRSLSEGFRTIYQTKSIWVPLSLWTFVVLLIAYEAPLLFPLVIEKQWAGGAAAAGSIIACAAIGSLVTSLYVLKSMRFQMGLLSSSIILMVDALALQVILMTSQHSTAMMVASVFGVTEVLFRTYPLTQIQGSIPKHLVGRVFSAIGMIQEPLRIFAMAASGVVVSTWNVRVGFWSAIGFEYCVGGIALIVGLGQMIRHRR